MNKYKELLIYIAFIIIFVIVMIASCVLGTVFTFESYMQDPASNLLGQKFQQRGELFDYMMANGMLACFFHNESQAGTTTVNRGIHSVYDLRYNETEGAIQAYSAVVTSWTVQEPTYIDADGVSHVDTTVTNTDVVFEDKTTFSNNDAYKDAIVKLAANAGVFRNAKGVREALVSAMDIGAVVVEPAISGKTQYSWVEGTYIKTGAEATDEDIAALARLEELINLYTNYKKIEDVDSSPEEKELHVTIGQDQISYTVVGPFKINFGGKGINNITAGDAKWTQEGQTDIYWTDSILPEDIEWRSDFNAQNEAGEFDLNNKYFYLAINTSKLPTSGQYTITMVQDEFEFYASRITVTAGTREQQMGNYYYYPNATKVNGQIEWTVERQATKSLQIIKEDERTGEELTGAQFKIYAELENGTTGWVTGAADAQKSYLDIAETATGYEAKVEIKELPLGTYYVYETIAPNGYSLTEQVGYHQTTDSNGNTIPGSGSITGDWVYLGSKSVNTSSNSVITVRITNKPFTTIIINKVDSKTGTELTGAKFQIYAELANGTTGWVTGEAEAEKTYTDIATQYDAKVNITGLSYGNYYVYETTAPNGYNLADQNGYHQEAPGSSSLSGDWVYLGSQTINEETPTENNVISVQVTNKPCTSILINKVDEKTGEELEGAKFILYAELSNGETGWLSGTADGEKTYANKATQYNAKEIITNLRYGTYYIYEVGAPIGYDLTEQEGYHQEAPGSNTLLGDWVYLGSQKLDDAYTSDEPFTVSITNKKLATMEIIKIDETTEMELEGGKFKIYAVLAQGGSGWVSGEANGSKTYGNTATEYTSGVQILNLKYGTYYIYETEGPEGYDLTKQDGYHQQAEGSADLTGDWVYLGTQVIDIDFPTTGIFTFTATNRKVVDQLEGFVWVDFPDTKENKYDYIYNNETNDILKQGITVNLYDESDTLIATTTTDSSGYYSFTSKNASSYTGEDKNLYYWELAQAYVEFIYNNKTIYEGNAVTEYGYVAIDPFVGADIGVNSKAQEYTITEERLDDNNLTGTTGANPGRAVTFKPTKIYEPSEILENTQIVSGGNASAETLKQTPLTGYYDNETYKISNINLGLLEQHDPEFSVEEILEYIKVRMNGYTYTYKYGSNAITNSPHVPTVNEQNSAYTFTGKIYPSDIAYNMETSSEELQVYVVYSINVKNTETINIDDRYVEQKLYLESLVNTYDNERYELCTDQNNDDSSDFALWSNVGEDEAKYDLNNNSSVYKDGINALETKTSFIQFKIKEEALEKILTGGLTYEDILNAPTQATAKGYHEYLRTDNAWEHNANVVAFEGCNNSYAESNASGEKYYVHKSISKEYKSSDLYLRLQLGEARKISGTVFEDIRTQDSADANTNLGNGILDSDEGNRAKDVTVTLLDANKHVAKLYQQDNGSTGYSVKDAITTTEEGGTFEFEGVVPGYYYIMFTYGDGTQKMMPVGTDIKSNDYRSTIINTADNDSIIKNALEASDEAIQNAQQTLINDYTNEDAKKLVEWYKYLNNSYSTAVDDLTQRMSIDGYSYNEDGSIYDASGNVVTDYPETIDSYTPMLGISIENDINDTAVYNPENPDEIYKNVYHGFNFGLIKQAETILNLEKKITNISYTTQSGANIISTNPADRLSSYVTALDNILGGSKYTKIEIDPSIIYGSQLETQYNITIKNETAIDYEDEDYYKYGIVSDSSTPIKIKINQVEDMLDQKYEYKELNAGTTGVDVSESETPEGTKLLLIKNMGSIAHGQEVFVEYTVRSLLSSNEDDTIYENEAKITSISLGKPATLTSGFDWNSDNLKDNTTLTVTPTTGEDRSNIYWVAGTVALITLALGFVVLKKKVLK